MSKSRLQDLLALAHVSRWGIVPTLRPQSVAEHSFNVAAIALEIADRLHLAINSRLVIIYHAFIHDAPEADTGDLASTLKQELPPHCLDVVEHVLCPWYYDQERRALPSEHAIVKIADKVEAVMYIGRWGVGDRASSALKRDKLECFRRIEEARARFGWTDLHAIVDDLIRSSGQSSAGVQLPSPDQPSPVSQEPSAVPPVRLPVLPVVRPPED